MSTKITLSANEMDLVNNTNWILTKHTIIEKIYSLFGQIAQQFELMVNENKLQLPSAVVNSSAKISKGEKYQQLPYVVLDYPRVFTNENIFAVRLFFWWGNFFSINLHVSGIYQEKIANKLVQHYNVLKEKDYFVCINDNPWEHHFEEDNFISLNTITQNEFGELVMKKSFIKISKKINLTQWNEVEEFAVASFKEMIVLLQQP